MRRHEPPEQRREDGDPPRREAGPQPSDAVLALQRAAGNRAVSALLARQPAPADAGPQPAGSRKAATMTIGLGEDDEYVIPVDYMHWHSEKELVVGIGADNPAYADMQNAWQRGTRFATGFASTRALMSRLAGVTIQTMQFSNTGDEPLVTMTLMVDDVEHQPVR